MEQKQFKLSSYMIPAIISMVVVGTNANIDGFFIGNILGDDGLAAINIVWPIVAFIASLGTGIGVGGSVIFNRMRGEGDTKTAERVKNTTLAFSVAAGLLSGLLICAFCSPLVAWMGAVGVVHTHALHYGFVISLGAVFQTAAAALLVLLRNDEKTYPGMVYSLLGLALHIGLDFLWAKPFGMRGVAAATVVSQGIITVPALFTLKIEKQHTISISYIPQIIKASLAPLGINFVPSLVLLFTNFFALQFGGVAAVSAYAAMSYAVYTFDYIFQGMCDGIQPIVSYCKGAGDKAQEKHAVKCGAVILGLFSVLCMVLTPALIEFMPMALSVSGKAAQMMQIGFIAYAVAYPFKAAVKFIGSYYYAAGKPMLSNILVYLDPLVFTPGFLWLGTRWFGTDGVWYSMPAAQMMLTVIGVCMIICKRKKQSKIY